VEPGYPLVLAANRDERLDRPAQSLCVLREEAPRVLGGRDELAGGTWLAVNEHGVVAGLTNRPSPGGRDPNKRSRGELPLFATGSHSADDGVAELVRRVQPGQYNPAWLLVGDRESLYYVEVEADRRPTALRLGAGIYVLENVALGAPSRKVEQVHALLSPTPSAGASLWAALPSVLADHTVPATAGDTTGDEQTGDGEFVRRTATLASCVHTDDYGTRSAALVRVPSASDTRPEILVADGPPCSHPFCSASARWSAHHR
jgi:uncharacterized protein with NRDE domain